MYAIRSYYGSHTNCAKRPTERNSTSRTLTAEAISVIDPYFNSLFELREQLSEVIQSFEKGH